MPTYTGSCSCRKIEYELSLLSPDDARTSLCHCRNCKVRRLHTCTQIARLTNKQKAFGTNYGLTTKVPKDSFSYTKGSPHQHAADNGSGVTIYREFCDTCGSFILEYGVCGENAANPYTLPVETFTNILIGTGQRQIPVRHKRFSR